MSRLTLCIILKNEEFFIKDCILSCIALVDAVILVDSGSTDQSLNIIQNLQSQYPQIKLYHRAWPNDFADQRNYAISQTQTDWILFLDADERIDTTSHSLIKKAISHSNVDAFLLPIKNYTNNFSEIGFTALANGPAAGFVLTHLHRLFRKDERIFYEGVLHERIEPSLQKHRLKTEPLDVVIHHFGPVKEQNLSLKKDRMHFYEDLGRAKINQNPEDAQAYWELGVVLQKQKKYDEASKEFKRAQELEPSVEEFEIYWLLSLFQQMKWKELKSVQPKFKKSFFFKSIAIAQTDPSEIDKLDDFRNVFFQASLLIFELSLMHQRNDRIERDRQLAQEHFSHLGLVDFIEGSFLTRKEKWAEALRCLESSHQKGCRLGLKEYLICLGKLNLWKDARSIIQKLSAEERRDQPESSLKMIELIERMPL